MPCIIDRNVNDGPTSSLAMTAMQMQNVRLHSDHSNTFSNIHTRAEIWLPWRSSQIMKFNNTSMGGTSQHPRQYIEYLNLRFCTVELGLSCPWTSRGWCRVGAMSSRGLWNPSWSALALPICDNLTLLPSHGSGTPMVAISAAYLWWPPISAAIFRPS